MQIGVIAMTETVTCASSSFLNSFKKLELANKSKKSGKLSPTTFV